jgi:DNA-binding MurR/RpiR family transcriptional regulator
MKAAPSLSFLSRVRAHLDAMHPTERRLAEFMLDFPGELASYSASELAKLSGVSNATVTRMVRRIGYATFEAARRHVREEKNSGSPLFLAGRGAAPAGTGSDAYLFEGADNLRRTFALLDEPTLQAIAQKIVAARKVWVMGLRSSHTLAAYLRMQLFQVKEALELFPCAGGSVGEYVASMQASDLVVLIGLRRRPARLRAIVQQIIDTGASVLYITDDKAARNAQATWHLHCACTSARPLDNHVAVIAIFHALVNEAIELAGHAGRKRLAAIEARHDALGEF